MSLNILEDGLIRTTLTNESPPKLLSLSLPEVYAAMLTEEVATFPALRSHQRHAWHAFLAQLGAIALARADMTETPTGASEWHRLLLALTQDWPDDSPWHLIGADPGRPAFLQCPLPDGLPAVKKILATPDDLDPLVTSKNHALKASKVVLGTPDDWIFALVNLQTMSGYGGAGNYGIARMNGGRSARPCLGLAPVDGGPGAHLAHDLGEMLANRHNLLRDYSDTGTALVWLVPWDGQDQLRLSDLDPHFIEICRRVRLAEIDGRIVARIGTSGRTRIAARHSKGNVGDHWTPIHKGAPKALSPQPGAFRYDRLATLLFDSGEFRLPSAMKPRRELGDRHWRLVARAVADGGRTSSGFQERTDIIMGPGLADAMIGGPRRQALEEMSEAMLDEVAAVLKALRFAVAFAASKGEDPQKLERADRRAAYRAAEPFLDRLHVLADAFFFPALQERFAAHEDDRRAVKREFTDQLVDRARQLLRDAQETVARSDLHRIRARVFSERAFRGSLRRSGNIDITRNRTEDANE